MPHFKKNNAPLDPYRTLEDSDDTSELFRMVDKGSAVGLQDLLSRRNPSP